MDSLVGQLRTPSQSVVPYRSLGALCDAAADRIEAQQATLERYRDALEACRAKFAEYVELHKAKLPDSPSYADAPSGWRDIAAKVERNQEMVNLCSTALSISVP